MNQNPLNNESFLQEAIEFVRNVMTEDEWMPTALLQRPDPNDPSKAQIVVAVIAEAFKSPETKAYFQQIAPKLAADFDAERVAVITEAWSYMPTGDDDPILASIMAGEMAVSDLPREQRSEILSVVMEANDGTTLATAYEIVEEPTRGLGHCLNPDGPSRAEARFKFFPDAHEPEQDLSEPQATFDLESLFA